MYKIPDNCEKCFAFSICAETTIRGKGGCLKVYKLAEEKFTSTNRPILQFAPSRLCSVFMLGWLWNVKRLMHRASIGPNSIHRPNR